MTHLLFMRYRVRGCSKQEALGFWRFFEEELAAKQLNTVLAGRIKCCRLGGDYLVVFPVMLHFPFFWWPLSSFQKGLWFLGLWARLRFKEKSKCRLRWVSGGTASEAMYDWLRGVVF